MADFENDGWALGCEAPDVESVKKGQKHAVVNDGRPRPLSERRIYFINLMDRAREFFTPARPSLAELNERAKQPPRGTKVETFVQSIPADTEMEASYSLLPRLK